MADDLFPHDYLQWLRMPGTRNSEKGLQNTSPDQAQIKVLGEQR